MRLETYLDAFAKAYSDIRPTLEQRVLTFNLEYYNHRLRQYKKFRQHILDCSIFYQRKDVPYYIADMAASIKKPPVRKPERKKKQSPSDEFDGAGVS